MNNASFEDQYQKMMQLVNQFLPLQQWGFHQTASVLGRNSRIIFDSQWCRMKIVWDGWDVYVGDMISIYYGRLHAPDDKNVISWNGEEYYCWHDLNEPLLFLDRLSPREAAERSIHGPRPNAMDIFDKSVLGKSLAHKQPEWLVRMHASIWEHYGQRLFELFDLRCPEIWREYTDFIKIFTRSKDYFQNCFPQRIKFVEPG